MNDDIPENIIDKTSSEQLKEAVLAALAEEKIDDVTVIPLAGRSALTDYMIIGSGTSSRRVAAAAQKLLTLLKPLCRRSPRCEGINAGDWVLVDAGDVIVHLFRPEVREHYSLEKMWDANQKPASGDRHADSGDGTGGSEGL